MQGRNARELTILRNEIFARHGRRFKEPELQRHFKSQSWYQPRYSPNEFPVALLSKTEIQNAMLIRDYQRAHGLE
ncbi:MAG: YARHG domain-containing protein [Leptolyngbyaceae cyanobacterium SU_3_3]|nr:YARHG domain-containing protein [Leptolyngbyaceae cyanobacterium SU_3_3]